MTADVDAEKEVDFGRLAGLVVARWWLPVAGLIIGIAVGYLLSLGGTKVYRAEALVSLGTPFTPGGAPLAGLTANPRFTIEIINSEAALRRAADAGGLPVSAVRGKVAARTVSSGVAAKAQGPQLMGIAVKGNAPRKVALAANALAGTVISRTAPYVQAQIRTYQNQLQTQADQLVSIQNRISALQQQVDTPGLAPLDRLVLVSYLDNAEQRRGTLLDSQATTQQQLTLAKDIESPSIIQPAVAVQTTARSRHNSMAVGGLIGLILGLLAALLWDWTAARMNHRPAV